MSNRRRVVEEQSPDGVTSRAEEELLAQQKRWTVKGARDIRNLGGRGGHDDRVAAQDVG